MWNHIGQIANRIQFQQFSCGSVRSQKLGLIIENKMIAALKQTIKLRNFSF